MVEVKNFTRRHIPNIPFRDIAFDVLGKEYDLSVVLVGNRRSQKLNAKYRGKDKPTNVLSFPLSKTEGELFLDLGIIEREARKQKENPHRYLTYIFIHGLLHLEGLDHGSIMEQKEQHLLDTWHAQS